MIREVEQVDEVEIADRASRLERKLRTVEAEAIALAEACQDLSLIDSRDAMQQAEAKIGDARAIIRAAFGGDSLLH